MDWTQKTHYTDLPEDIRSKVKTERQWAKSGYLPIADKTGAELWANRNHNARFKYFHESEVRIAEKGELDSYFAEERKKKREQHSIRRETKKKELAEEKAELVSESVFLRNRKDQLRENYHELCRQIGYSAPIAEVQRSRKVVVDTETTGLECGHDEILQVSIIDADTSRIIFNELFKPFMVTEWPEAQKINNISPDMVKDKRYFVEAISQINHIFSGVEVVIGYNTLFDINFMSEYGVQFHTQKYIDVMEIYAEYNGEPDEQHGGYKWKKLTECASALGYQWGVHKAHDSLGDCYATLYSYRQICKAEKVKEMER